MAKHIRISPADRITINSISYTGHTTNNGGQLLQRADGSGMVEPFTHNQLDALWETNALRYEPDYYTPEMCSLRLENGTLSVADLAEKERDLILWKKGYCDAALKLIAQRLVTRTYPALEDAALAIKPEIDRLGLGAMPTKKKARKARSGTKKKDTLSGEFREAPSGKTLHNWLKAYERGGCHAISLRERIRFSGNYGSKLPIEVEAIMTIEVAKYASDLKPTPELVIGNISRAIEKANTRRQLAGLDDLSEPSAKAVRAAIKRLDPFYTLVMREGRAYAEAHMSWVGKGLISERPGQRIQIDEHEVDLVTLAIRSGIWELLEPAEKKAIKRVRRWISVAICCATRVILGMRILNAPCKEGALATLKMVTMDKGGYADAVGALSPWDQKCSLSRVEADWGAAYASAEVRAAIADARATQAYPPPGHANLRGFIERVFGTVAAQLIARLHGRTWSDISKRGDYDSAGKAGITDDELAIVLVRYVVDAYHNTPHDELRGETPADAWTRLTSTQGYKAPPDAHARRSMFGLTVTRTITNRGIRVLGNYYRSSEDNQLGKYFLHDRQLDVDVRVDPDNLGVVSVKLHGVYIPVSCEDTNMEGRTAANWMATMSALRSKYKTAAGLSRQKVFAAFDDIERLNDGATRRALICAPMTSVEDINYAEAAIFANFEMPRDIEGSPSDLLGESIAPLDLATATLSIAGSKEAEATQSPRAIDIHDGAVWQMKD